MNDIEHIWGLNEKYLKNDFNGESSNADSNCSYKVIYGKLPILLSAPHAVRQNRGGEVKGADTLTGPIVEHLCETTNVYGIVRTVNLQDDPNFENTGHSLKYKDAILSLTAQGKIACVIDIHGCKDRNTFDIDIGTNRGKNINGVSTFLDVMLNKLSTVGKVAVDGEFLAESNTTVCNYVHRKSGISCFQIELCRTVRQNSDRLQELLNAFEKIISELSRKIAQMECEAER